MASEDATVKAVMDAMKPMLDLMKSEIFSSQQAAIIQLKESFLQQILQLNNTISEYTTGVVTLECGDPHKASDRSCPMRIKTSQEFRLMKFERANQY
jgi:hypothetical protein